MLFSAVNYVNRKINERLPRDVRTREAVGLAASKARRADMRIEKRIMGELEGVFLWTGCGLEAEKYF